MQQRRARIVIVGAGVGGLSCAIALASRGYQVSVVERDDRPGGKIARRTVGGVTIDTGPTVLTMPWVFEELFALADARLADYLALQPLEVVARHFWSDGTRLDLFANRERNLEAIGDAFGAQAADQYATYWEQSKRIYETVRDPFLRSQRPTLATIARQAGLKGLTAMARIDAFTTMASRLATTFSEPKLRQLFGRYATYCGGSPFETSGTFNLIGYVEAQGVYRVTGGMPALALALERRARELGVDFHYGVDVTTPEPRALGADAVVFNGDIAALPQVAKRARRSLSAVTFAIKGRAAGLPLAYHNVFFSDDYAAEFAGRVPDAPSVYMCAQADERFFLIINAPPTGDEPERWQAEERDRCRNVTLATMRKCGLTMVIDAMEQTTPVELNAAFPGTGGAIYGPSPHGATATLSRSDARTRVKGLYVAGGSVHPGPGVPMAALSGMRAAERIAQDIALTYPSAIADTRGITSTA